MDSGEYKGQYMVSTPSIEQYLFNRRYAMSVQRLT